MSTDVDDVLAEVEAMAALDAALAVAAEALAVIADVVHDAATDPGRN